MSRRLREKLSNAGPAKGLARSAVMEKELTTMPTMEGVAPRASAYTGSVVLVMNAAMDWKRLTAMSAR